MIVNYLVFLFLLIILFIAFCHSPVLSFLLIIHFCRVLSWSLFTMAGQQNPQRGAPRSVNLAAPHILCPSSVLWVQSEHLDTPQIAQSEHLETIAEPSRIDSPFPQEGELGMAESNLGT